MTLLLIVLLPFMGAYLPVHAIRRGRGRSALAASAVAALSFTLLLIEAPKVLRGEIVRMRWEWLPEVGLSFSFMMDGLGLLFALLILGVGQLVLLYAKDYLIEKDPDGLFFTFLLLFMGSMLGVVLSENIILLIVFWELTSLTSFLLIGYWRHLPKARQGARMALTVTGLGGLCLLGGAILLGRITGSYELGVILSMAPEIQAHPLHIPALLLFLVGAFTKSAQFPFHFWLPHAMAAPTPVSAYLHSATMVKAGVFLLARFWPVFAGTSAWFFLVTGAGITTLLVGAYIANLKNDLKALLAYSTISHLGLITTLLGFGTPGAAIAALFHILNHALFKASLFMSVGIIDNQIGTRELSRLGGLRHIMPITTLLSVGGAAAMGGIPPMNGFLSKEAFLTAAVDLPIAGGSMILLLVLVSAGSLLSVTYALRFGIEPFFGPRGEAVPTGPRRPPRGMRFPVEILVGICLLIGLFPNLLATPLLAPAVEATLGRAGEPLSLSLWHGVNLPLLISLGAIAGAVILWRFRGKWADFHAARLPLPEAKRIFDGLIERLVLVSRRVTFGFQNGSLQRALGVILLTAILLPTHHLFDRGLWLGTHPRVPLDPVIIPLFVILLCASAGAVYFHRRRTTAVVFVGATGLAVSLVFVHLSAPDLALTQISVEVITVILFLLALHLFPNHPPRESSFARRTRDGLLAVGAGGAMTALTWLLLTHPFESVSDFHLAESKRLGGGNNVVNVTLVDFRGFDTFGEITVLAMAGIAIFALLQGLGIPRAWRRSQLDDEDSHPLVLMIIARSLLPLALVVALHLFLRGHNLPGGGFIAALVVSAALILQYVASGMGWIRERLQIPYRRIIGMGLLIALITGAAPWIWNRPFLTNWHDTFHFMGELELASALFFDLGVFLTVVGSVMLIMVNLGKLSEAERVVQVIRRSRES